jgi:hypothetical protein
MLWRKWSHQGLNATGKPVTAIVAETPHKSVVERGYDIGRDIICRAKRMYSYVAATT